MAATYLLQLRERNTQNQTDQAPVVSNSSSRYQHVVPPDYSNTNPSQYMYTSMSNSLDPQGMIYSETNMKNTVAGLSNAIAIMQQQQATMEIKQGTISSTLTNVMTLLQDLANKSQNSSQNSCTDGIQNGSQKLTDVPRVEQNVSLQDRARGDQSTTRIAQDMARGSRARTVNTVWPEDHQSTAAQQYREYNWENRDG